VHHARCSLNFLSTLRDARLASDEGNFSTKRTVSCLQPNLNGWFPLTRGLQCNGPPRAKRMDLVLMENRETSVGSRKGGSGDSPEARFYNELRALAAHHMKRERPDHTLQPTALAHEALIRLAEQSGIDHASKTKFMVLASEMIRRILVDHARSRATAKRGGGKTRLLLEELVLTDAGERPVEILDLDSALHDLAQLNPRQARVVELKFFGDLSLDEIAESLGVSRGTVKGDWRIARAWLRVRLGSDAAAIPD